MVCVNVVLEKRNFLTISACKIYRVYFENPNETHMNTDFRVSEIAVQIEDLPYDRNDAVYQLL